MTTTDHTALRELVLSYELLSPNEREEADRHLSACETCRSLLVELQALEQVSGPHGELPSPEEAQLRTRHERDRERASLDALLAKIPGDERPVIIPRRRLGSKPLFGWGAGVSALLAAAVLALVFLPRGGIEAPAVSRVTTARASGPRGSGEHAPLVTSWHLGDRVSLTVEVQRSVSVVVVEIDPLGHATLLEPPGASSPTVLLAAGRHELPESDPPGWLLDAPAGRHIFAVIETEAERQTIDDALASVTASSPTGGPAPEPILAALAGALGPAHTTMIEVLP